jgi:alpha-N-arabinofuranosidase
MATITVDAGRPGPNISRHLYGHFAEHLGRCIYDGLWVGEASSVPNVRGIRTDVVEALKRIRIPNLRWPGGCFADEYHWRDGIGPRDRRPATINTHWGGVTETNAFGTHEFMDLCAQLGCEPVICGNVGTGTPQEMREWVEYLTFGGVSAAADLRRANGRADPWRVPWFGVGNESWGCGGHMRPEHYADLYRRYQTFVKSYSGNEIRKIACGPNEADERWTEVLMREAGGLMWGLSLHMYVWTHAAAADFDDRRWYETLKRALWMDELVARHGAIMDRYDPERKVALVVDEWGAWHRAEPGTNPSFLHQQNTLRDALVAGLTLNVFNNRCERVRMANLAQMVNVLQSPILTEPEGGRMILTPTYYVFELFVPHHDADRLPVVVDAPEVGPEGARVPAVTASASRAADGTVHLTLCHTDLSAPRPVTIRFRDLAPTGATGRVLTADDPKAHNTGARPDAVTPRDLPGIRVAGNQISVSLPPASVSRLAIR